MLIAGVDAKLECGADQLCAGLEAGIEAAAHAMNDLFSEHAGLGWGVLLVDNRYDLFCLFCKYGLE
jgi:hypothetical protein